MHITSIILMLQKDRYRTIELKRIDPAKLVGEQDNSYQNFILSIAYIYNDLKDLHLIYLGFKNNSINPKNELNSYTGEYYGLDNHLKRIVISSVYECLVFFEKNRKQMNYDSINRIMSKAPAYIQTVWTEIQDVVDNKQFKGSEIKKLLCLIRANVSFHYYQSHKVLRKSYIDFFKRTDMGKFNRYAYYSLGSNMEETRFFFADAAAQEYMHSVTKQFADFDNNFLDLLAKLNHTFMYILKHYISQRKQ